MDIEGFNTDKKALPIAGIILMLIAILGYLVVLLDMWVLKNVLLHASENILPFLISIIVFFCAGIVCRELAKKNKYGSWKLIRFSDILSKIFVVIIILGLILNLIFN